MNRLEKLFKKAVAEFHGGAFRTAETTLGKLDKLQPGIPDVLHLLGLIALQTDRPERAVKQFHRLVKAQPNNAEFNSLHGSALLRSGEAKQAIGAFQSAIDAEPDCADYYYNRARAERETGNAADAEAGFREALRRAPDLTDARYNLGQMLRRRDQPEEALDCFHAILETEPAAFDAMIEAGETLNSLQRYEEAAEILRRATALAPDQVEALHAFGIACYYLKRYTEAEEAFRRSLALAPDSFHVFNSLGNLMQRIDRLAEAEACFREALKREPGTSSASSLNLGRLLLLTGDYEEGWRQQRGLTSIAYRGAIPKNLWDGGDLTGKTIRVYGDQGVGDVVMFAGLLPELQSLAARCVLEIDDRLAPLFHRSFPDVEIIGRPRDSALGPCDTPIDAEIIFSELPRYLRGELAAHAKPDNAYLKADPAHSSEIRRRYKADGDKLLVGVAWCSRNRTRPERDAPLPLWGPILSQANARFISLQYGPVADDIAEAERHHGVTIHDDPEIDQGASLDDLASQIAALDLVVSISQSSAHFAGALGKTVFTMIPKVPDWRYRLNVKDTIWYPNMNLYRQTSVDAWEDVIEDVAKDMARFAP